MVHQLLERAVQDLMLVRLAPVVQASLASQATITQCWHAMNIVVQTEVLVRLEENSCCFC